MVLNSVIYNSFDIKQVNNSYDQNCILLIDWSKWTYSNCVFMPFPTQRVKFIDNFLVLICNMNHGMVDNKKHDYK